MQPSTGFIKTVGRTASLLELGAGFHPELTGRENVFMNGQILGLKNRDIERRFDEIVEFAELEQFIDQQVKHYSSGMYVRLGFAVATNVDPDVLLIDEVLAVGDEAFQRKCLNRIRQFQREGRTMMFVSHSPELVRQICDRAVVLDHGHMIDIGPPGEAIRTFGRA
jgi:ABC-2 type transport system ATP-binding protein